MITRCIVERFKSIERAEFELGKINIFIGSNNSGKSSILQAMQFATSIAQSVNQSSQKPFKDNKISTTIASDQLIYAPIRDVLLLAYNEEELTRYKEKGIQITFFESNDAGNGVDISCSINISRGKNKNLSISIEGELIGDKLKSIDNPYCMYVPGLAGIPFSEEYHAIGAIRRAAAKGDCNTVLRNVLYLIHKDAAKWRMFIDDIRVVFPEIGIEIIDNLNTDGTIDIMVIDGNRNTKRPIDAMGTGVLQAIQICCYINFFQPKLLLLDEPDSHLHPNNQRIVARLLENIVERYNTKIILATHSRHLINALQNTSSCFIIKDSTIIQADYDEYAGLLELGALDSYDMIKSGNIKYVFLTEDQGEDSLRLLKTIIEASGYIPNEYCVFPYKGCSNIETAVFISMFMYKLNRNVKIIIHRDKDSMYPDEVREFIDSIERQPNAKAFITNQCDIEMYFCNPNHIKFCLDLNGFQKTIIEIQAWIARIVNDIREESKIRFYGQRSERDKKNRGQAQAIAEQEFARDMSLYIYGKKAFGLLKQKIHEETHLAGSKIEVVSPFLSIEILRRIQINP